jgi:hypothetical protein
VWCGVEVGFGLVSDERGSQNLTRDGCGANGLKEEEHHHGRIKNYNS